MKSKFAQWHHAWWVPTMVLLALVGAACGGGDTEADSGSSSGDTEQFDPASLTGAEICEMIPVDDVRAALGGDDAFAEPSGAGSACRFEVFSDQTTVGGATVTLVNNGGAAGLDAQVAFWEARATVSDLAPSEIGTEAHLVENASVRKVLFRSTNWVWEIGGPSGSSEEDLAEMIRLAKAVYSHL